MTTIKASCPVCGEIELTRVDVTLIVCNQTSLSHYSFACPKCQGQVRKPADNHVVSLLMSAGVTAVCWDIPAEAREVHSGPVLTHNEVLDFMLDLEIDEARSVRD